MNDCESMLAYFYDTINNLLNTHLPIVYIKRHSNSKPWVNEHLCYLIRCRQNAFTSGDLVKYRSLRNKVQRVCKNLKKQYASKCIENVRKHDSRKWWTNVKRIIGQTSSQCPLSSIAAKDYNGDMQLLANVVNSFLQNVSSDLNPVDLSYCDCLENDFNDSYVIDPYMVEKKLNAIDIHKSNGPDDIPNWILRDFSVWLAEPLCAIFNVSIRTGVVPHLWKHANVIPIPKINPPTKIESDIRPISLTPTVSKILESFVGQWILELTQEYIDQYQFGGVKGKSTTHALVSLLDYWHRALDENKQVRVLFIDYAKAFDHIDHTLFIDKLTKIFKLPHFMIKWIHSFISNRLQRVKIGKIVSDWLTFNGGLP